jgi:hypothetical protein
VERDPTVLLAVDRPEEAEVEREETLLLVAARPVEREPTPL